MGFFFIYIKVVNLINFTVNQITSSHSDIISACEDFHLAAINIFADIKTLELN